MKNLIDYAYNDNGTEFRDALYSAIHDKVAAHIEAKKQEIAAGLMGQQFEEEAELDEEFELEESFFGRIKSVPEIISAVKAANNGDIEGMKHHAKKYAEKQSSDSSKHAELQKKIYSHLAQKSTHPSSRAVAKSLSEEFELAEDAGAYETWDPKHPHFVKNYKKYQSDNANQGSIKDFIEKEKARPRRLSK